jgi:predicted secreted protein
VPPRSLNRQQPFFNVVAIEASATSDVTDTLTVTLFVEEQGPDGCPWRASTRARVMTRAKKEPKVEAHSGSYQTTPVYDRANQITGWRTRADIVLESRDFKAVSALAGALQPGLKLGSMTFSLSRAAREAADAALLTEALSKFQERARAVAKGLGFPGFQLGQINVRNEGSVRPPPIAYRQVAMVGARPKARVRCRWKAEKRRHRLCLRLDRAGTGKIAHRRRLHCICPPQTERAGRRRRPTSSGRA